MLHALVHRLLPNWIYQRLIGDWDKEGFKKYFKNTGWIFIAKMVSFVVSFFTIAIVARYLGPENLGKLSYAQSFVSIFSIFASLGIDLIIYRDLVAHPEKENELLGTAVMTKLFFGSLTFLVTIIASITISTDNVLTWLIGIIALSFIFQPFGTVGHLFNAQVLSKYPSYISIFLAFFIPALKLLVIFFDKGILYFAGIIAFEALFYGVANIILYVKILKKTPRNWSISFTLFKKLFHESWPLLLAGLSNYIYARIDQVMIQHIIDSTAVGLYEVAVRLTEPLSFLPGVIIGSLFPAIINAKTADSIEYHKRFKSLAILCLGISFILVLILFVCAPYIIKLLFGAQFIESVHILRVYVWTNLGTVATSLIYNYFITENKTKAFLVFTVFGASINVTANVFLIPHLGIVGAAYATLLTLFCIVLLFLLTKNNLLKRAGFLA